MKEQLFYALLIFIAGYLARCLTGGSIRSERISEIREPVIDGFALFKVIREASNNESIKSSKDKG